MSKSLCQTFCDVFVRKVYYYYSTTLTFVNNYTGTYAIKCSLDKNHWIFITSSITNKSTSSNSKSPIR